MLHVHVTSYRYMLQLHVIGTCYRCMLQVHVTGACYRYMFHVNVTVTYYRYVLHVHAIVWSKRIANLLVKERELPFILGYFNATIEMRISHVE